MAAHIQCVLNAGPHEIPVALNETRKLPIANWEAELLCLMNVEHTLNLHAGE